MAISLSFDAHLGLASDMVGEKIVQWARYQTLGDLPLVFQSWG